MTTELVSNDAKLPQCTLHEAGCDPLCEEAVSNVILVDPSETATVSVDPIESAADLVLGVWEALKKKKKINYEMLNMQFIINKRLQLA